MFITVRQALALGVLCGAFSLLQAVEREDKLERSTPARAGGSLVFETDYGSVDVRPGAGNAVRVVVDRKVEAAANDVIDRILKDLQVEMSDAAGATRVRVYYREGWKPRGSLGRLRRQMCRNNECLEWADNLERQSIAVEVPRQFQVDVKTSGGRIGIDGIEGRAAARTSGGGIEVSGVTGAAEVKTSGGSIRVRDLKGDLVANTSGGSIRLANVTGKISAHTSGGSVSLENVGGPVDATTSGGSVAASFAGKLPGDTRLATSGGSVTVALAPGSGANLDATASGGKVHVDFPVQISGDLNKRNHVQAPINGGGPLLHLRTSGGSVTVKRL